MADMSEDWNPGDLAECVADNLMQPPPGTGFAAPAKGDTLMVFDIDDVTALCLGCGEVHRLVGLEFIGKTGWCWAAKHFRKVQPKGEDRKVRRRESVPA